MSKGPSKFGRINGGDLIRGLFVAVAGAALSVPATAVQGGFSWDWKSAAVFGGTAGLAYLLKNLATDEGGRVLGIKATASK